MSDENNSDKTEQPTGKRLSEAFERGQFAKSPEIQIVAVIGAALLAFTFNMGTACQEVAVFSTNVFTQLGRIRMQLDTVPTLMIDLFLVAARVVLPVIIACALGAILAGGIQSGFQLTPKTLELKFEALNPMPGLQRMFSKQTFVHAGIDLLKVVAIALILWTVAKGLIKDPMFTAPVEAAYLGRYMERATYAFLSRLLLALGCIAAISYAYEKFRMNKELMMSRQEVKEENKQNEGSPEAKNAMRRMARRLMQKQMLGAVETADVVVTNPTHYAVALKYERGVDSAPIVVAKGENGFAKRIKAIAAENGVPTIENKPVARALFALAKVDEPIPNELFQAVAQILALVYRTHRYYFFRLKSRRAEAARQAAQA